MRKLLLVFALFIGFVASAQPKYFRTMYYGDPSQGFTIGFSEDLLSIPFSYQLYYSEIDHGTNIEDYALDNEPVGVDRTVQLMKGMRHHFVRLKNLKPNTFYYFVVQYTGPAGHISNVSDRFYCKTMSNNSQDPISFVAGGDSRLNIDEGPIATIESITIRKEANKMVAKLSPDFVAFGGDFTFANTEIEWIQWFKDWELTYSNDGKITPIVPAIGNHEVLPFGCPQCDNSVIHNLFDTPSKDNYYAVSFNNNLLRMYTLNTEMTIEGAQTDWLLDDLANNRKTLWKSAQYHKPMRPHEAGKSDKNDAFENWAIPFYNEQVRLVIECDAHVVKTTWPLYPTLESDGETICGQPVDHNFARIDNGKGTTFVGEGTWAALRTGDDPKLWTRDLGSINQVKWVWVYENEIQVRTVQTYKTNDPEYVNNVETLNNDSRFTIPNGIALWEDQEGPLLTIRNNGSTPIPNNPCETVGVKNLDLFPSGMVVAPNPSQDGIVNIRLKNTANQSKVEVYSMNGNLIKTHQFTGNFTKLNLGQSKGVYLISVKNSNGEFLEKLIIK